MSCSTMLNLQKDSKDFYYQLDSYDYTLPEELIATHPQDNRSSSQLLNCEIEIIC